MKKKATLFILLASVVAAIAVNIPLFNGLDDLVERSPDIFIARVAASPPSAIVEPTNSIQITADVNGVVPAAIEILDVLKGEAKPGPSLVWLDDPPRFGVLPRQGDMFLVFAIKHDGIGTTNSSFTAIEDYGTVIFAREPHFTTWTNAFAGKPLRAQIEKVIQSRLRALDQEVARDQEEKKHLEDGLKELSK